MSFRQRLGLFLIVTLVLVQSVTAASAYFYLRQDLLAHAKRELGAAMGVFTRQLEFVSERVADGVHVLSLDFALRSAIARRDLGTQLSALNNHGDRIGATRMMITRLDGRITADTGKSATGERFLYPSLLHSAEFDGKGTGLVSDGRHVYWAVVVPVRAPVPIAYVAAFIPIHDGLLRKMQAISSSHQSISLLIRTRDGSWRVAAETAKRKGGPSVIAAPLKHPTSKLSVDHQEEFFVYTAPLEVATGSLPVAARLKYPLHEALAAYRGIVLPMILVLVLGLIGMLIGVALIARGVSRPLETLAAAARRIAVGDYRLPPHSDRKDEIGVLSDALMKMTASIAEREQGLRSAIRTAEEAKGEAVQANRAKSDFLSNMSHELRTPLNAIIGFSEMIGSEALGPVGVPKYADYAKDVHRSGAYLLGLVERMLTLAEADAGRLALNSDSFPASQPFQAAIETVEPFAVEANVTFAVNEPLQWPVLTGESQRLKEALANILHNAVKFSPAGGVIIVNARIEADALLLEVRDAGGGIPPDILPIVTQPFHRLKAAFDGTHQGAGLGLPYARVIVESHGGSLSIASAPGEGTTVILSLPCKAVREAMA